MFFNHVDTQMQCRPLLAAQDRRTLGWDKLLSIMIHVVQPIESSPADWSAEIASCSQSQLGDRVIPACRTPASGEVRVVSGGELRLAGIWRVRNV